MSKVTLPAYCLDDPDLQNYLRRNQIEVVDRSEAPWAVTFEGPNQALRDMIEIHWDTGVRDDIEEILAQIQD